MNFSKLENKFEKTISVTKLELVIIVVKKYLQAILIRLKVYKIVNYFYKVLKVLVKRLGLDTKLLRRVLAKLNRMFFSSTAKKTSQNSIALSDISLQEIFIYQGEIYRDVNDCIRAIRKIDCKVVVCCAFKGRHRVLEGVLLDILDDASIGVCLAGSTVQDLDFLRRLTLKNSRIFGVITDNSPLGAKWQKVVDVATGFFETDLFAITGSDDVLPTSTLHDVYDHYTDSKFKPALYGSRSWYTYYWLKDGFQRGCLKSRYSGQYSNKTLGAGRVYTKDFFNIESNQIFDKSKSRRLDELGHDKAVASSRDIFFYDGVFDLPISIKGGWDQLNDIAQIAGAKTLTSEHVKSDDLDQLFLKNSAMRIFSLENESSIDEEVNGSKSRQVIIRSNGDGLIVKVPCLSDLVPAHQFVDLSAAQGTYMYKMFAKDGLCKFESEALGITAALIDYYNFDEFADVGANIGVFSWCMKAIFGKKLAVSAYEPLPMLSNILKDLCQSNDLDISIHTQAMSDRNGEAIFYVSASTDSSNSLNKDFREAKDEIKVETMTMTTAFGNNSKPRVIKIDTETTEPAVLAGGAEYIDRERPFLIVEVLANRTEEPMSEFCVKHKYNAYRLDRSKLEPASDIVGDKTYTYRDWLFAPAEITFDDEFNECYINWVSVFSGKLEV